MWGLSLLASACLMSLTPSSPGCDRVASRSHLREEGCLWTLSLGDAICHGGKVWQPGLCDSKFAAQLIPSQWIRKCGPQTGGGAGCPTFGYCDTALPSTKFLLRNLEPQVRHRLRTLKACPSP